MARRKLPGLNVSLDLRVEEWWMGQDMPVWSLDLKERLMYLIFEIISDIKVVLDVLVRHFTL